MATAAERSPADSDVPVIDLAQAPDRGELRLQYQPILDLRTRDLVGVEALVRWDHPRTGLLAPSEFIHTAEECGAIGTLGR